MSDPESLRSSENALRSSIDASAASHRSAIEASVASRENALTDSRGASLTDSSDHNTDTSTSTATTTTSVNITTDPVSPTATSTEVASGQTPTPPIPTSTANTTTSSAGDPIPTSSGAVASPSSSGSILSASSSGSGSSRSQSVSGSVSSSISSISSSSSGANTFSPPTPEQPAQNNPPANRLAPGVIAGLAVGAAVSAAIFAGVLWRCYYLRRARRRVSDDTCQEAVFGDENGVRTGPSTRPSSSSSTSSSNQLLSHPAASARSLKVGARAVTREEFGRPPSMSTIATAGVPFFDPRASLIRGPSTDASQRRSGIIVSRTESTLIESPVHHVYHGAAPGVGVAFWSQDVRDLNVQHIYEQDGGVRLAGGPLDARPGPGQDGIVGDIKSVLPPPYSSLR